MKDYLVETFGLQCWGCDFQAPDERYLQLDHIDPKADGGSNHLDNRALLCSPCNLAKSNKLTLGAPPKGEPKARPPHKATRNSQGPRRTPDQPTHGSPDLQGGTGESPPRASKNVVANDVQEKGIHIHNIPPESSEVKEP